MLERGDKEEDAKNRIIHDRIAFKKENVADVDHHVDSQHFSIEGVTDYIYKKYIETLEQRRKK